eukprot:m.140605 g.140605  ORF g.140605 m.140605 type:complete len:267 (+) comp17091_c0_seq1:16-816(+)
MAPVSVCLLLACVAIGLAAPSLRCELSHDGSYSIDVADDTENGDQQPFLVGERVAVYHQGVWHAAGHNLSVASVTPISGSDKIGAFTGTEITWQDASVRGNNETVSFSFVTSVAQYESGVCVLSYGFPQGAKDTAFGYLPTSKTGAVVNFPATSLANTTNTNSVLSWQGSFSRPSQSATYGSTAGPYLFFDGEDPADKPAVLAGPLDHFLTTSNVRTEPMPAVAWPGLCFQPSVAGVAILLNRTDAQCTNATRLAAIEVEEQSVSR